MMPAHSRHSDRHSARAPAPSLPPVNHEATAPFSDLFKSGFDAATVDATAQLADRSIFVASNGRRYLVESLPEDAPVYGRVPTSPPVPAATAPPASFYTPSPTISGSPAPAYPAYPVYHPVPPPQFQVHAPGPGPGWGRSSNASSHSSSPSAYSAQVGYAGGVVPAPEPRGPALQVTNMMARLNMNRFSATPMYGMSDGGVQAAETLTDPDLAPRSPTSPTNPTRLSPGASYFDQQQHQQPSPPPHPQASSWGPHGSPGAAPQHWTNINYANYTVQANQHLQDARQRAMATTGLPSLLEGATTLTPPHRASDPAFSTDKEVWEGPTSASPYYYSPLHASVSAPSSYVNRGPPGEFDTLTPVTVIPHHTPSFSSDGASTGRDNVLPGEDLLFDGPVKSSQSLTSPVFREGVLKVFRSTLTNDLRFHCKVDRESETYWIKASNAQLVPAYAFDQRLSNVVYIRDTESDKGTTGYSQGNSRLSGIYQFSSLRELCDFQARLTGEKVVLDIGSVRMVTLSKANSRSSTQFSGARLQMWHELEGHRRGAQPDAASFVTAGTAVSGPLRERVVVSPSKLMLYLGRGGEYISVFITDDIEVKTEGQTLVKLKARKGTMPFSRKGSRWQWVRARLQRSHGAEPAGLDIHGRAVEADVGADYDSYKTFEIEFENSPSQDNFVRKWDEVVKERRAQRARLMHIQEEMESSVFTGRQARDVFM